jgi:hypothetical protein
LSRSSSGKEGIKKKKKYSSGARTSKPTIFLLGFLLVVVGIFGIIYNPSNSIEETLPWKLSEAGLLSFSPGGEPAFTAQEIEDTYSPEDPDTLKLLSFESSGENVQALLRIPANASSPSPGVILLPGAGVSKEREQGLAVELSRMGYATLTLDQRNQGAINVER